MGAIQAIRAPIFWMLFRYPGKEHGQIKPSNSVDRNHFNLKCCRC